MKYKEGNLMESFVWETAIPGTTGDVYGICIHFYYAVHVVSS